jgi:hypothetical protein
LSCGLLWAADGSVAYFFAGCTLPFILRTSMTKKRKTKQRTSDYKPVFTDTEYKLMQNYGVGDLLDEIGLNRVVLLRTMDKMNEERKQLTFRDHLDTLRSVSYTTGRIASLLEIRERLYQPYQEVEKQYKEYFDQVEEINEP